MRRTLALTLLLWALASTVTAGDWPQILGPNRTGIAAGDEKLLPEWRRDPAVVWKRPVGTGYAGPVVAGERLILFHRIDTDEVVECLNARTGQPLWKQSYGTTFRPQVGGGDGPLCTPAIIGDKVVTFGAQGVLSCYDLARGTPLWQRETHREFAAQEGYFGAGSTPIVVEEMVVVNVGGTRKNSGLVGFSLATGETKWQQTTEQGSYSAPTVVSLEGSPRVIAVTRLKCVGLDPATGAQWFDFRFGARGPTVNGASPIVLPSGELFVTSSYGVGSTLGHLSPLGCEPVYSGDEILATQYATPIAWQKVLFAIDGRDDIPPSDLKCVDPIKRKTLWSTQGFGYGTLLLADNKLLALKTDGELVMVEANTERYVELGRTRLFDTTTRALPALSRGLLFARDEQTLKCVNLK